MWPRWTLAEAFIAEAMRRRPHDYGRHKQADP
jgi:hypothetical protein